MQRTKRFEKFAEFVRIEFNIDLLPGKALELQTRDEQRPTANPRHQALPLQSYPRARDVPR